MPSTPPGLIDAALVDASRALSLGRPLEALARLGTRTDAHALALRGIALAQLGELTRGRASLSAALKRFRKARATLWMAKAAAAIAEIDLARRDLPSASRALDSRALRALGDGASAAYLDVLRARLLAMLGRRDDAEALLASAPWGPAALLARAEILARRGRFAEAAEAARAVPDGNPLLHGEAMRLRGELIAPRFRLRRGDAEEPISLVDIGRLRGPTAVSQHQGERHREVDRRDRDLRLHPRPLASAGHREELVLLIAESYEGCVDNLMPPPGRLSPPCKEREGGGRPRSRGPGLNREIRPGRPSVPGIRPA